MEGDILISIKKGIVEKIIEKNKEISIIIVNINSLKQRAINYNCITGEVNINDEVVLNCTAVELGLGTGGYHFVIYNTTNNKNNCIESKGHIMKLRYTPLQLKCLTAEEQSSPYHGKFNNFKSLNNSIIIVGTLHSMLAPIATVIKSIKPELNINYIMTDGGALPIQFSKTINILKRKKIINKTITIGHSFGGDLECINIYTGLIASKEVLNSDVTIVTMGPGIVGTNTKYGFSGIEQGYIIDAANKLGGKVFAVPRISFSDNRKRHHGLSHHSITIFSKICCTKANIVIPMLEKEKLQLINNQLYENRIKQKHNLIYEDGNIVGDILKTYNLHIKTMNRTFEQDKEFFYTLGAVGKHISNLCI